MMLIPEFIILHHSLTKDGATVSWGRIRDYHLQKGWRDIGYHYGVELARDHYEAFVGRPIEQKGAHCLDGGMNRRAIGVCFVGNFDHEPPPREQWLAGVRLVKSLCNTHNIRPDNIFGHRHFAKNRTCPGAKFDIAAFKREVERT